MAGIARGVLDDKSSDVIVLGAGLAGATAAYVLGQRGYRVTLVDPRPVYPSCFKAEKIQLEQVELFRKLGLMDVLVSRAALIREVFEADNGRVRRRLRYEHYGIRYDEMVNEVRRRLPPSVRFKQAPTASELTRLPRFTIILASA